MDPAQTGTEEGDRIIQQMQLDMQVRTSKSKARKCFQHMFDMVDDLLDWCRLLSCCCCFRTRGIPETYHQHHQHYQTAMASEHSFQARYSYRYSHPYSLTLPGFLFARQAKTYRCQSTFSTHVRPVIRGRANFEVSAGGWIRQNVEPDSDVSMWTRPEGTRESRVRIAVLDAMAFESLTGIPAPELPAFAPRRMSDVGYNQTEGTDGAIKSVSEMSGSRSVVPVKGTFTSVLLRTELEEEEEIRSVTD